MSSYYEKILATGEVKCIDEEIPFEIPQGWKWERIGNLFETTSGSTPLSRNPDYYQNGSINWVRTTDLNNGVLCKTEIQITEKACSDYNLTILPRNSVCIAMYGGAGTIGKHSILQFDTTINQSVCAIKPNGYCNMDYLHTFIEYQRPYWMDFAAGSRKDPNINQLIIKHCLLPIPPQKEQVRIVENLRLLNPHIARFGECQIKLEHINKEISDLLKKSILQEAIQGKLVPQIAEEGTAQELLEQIKAEKQKLIKEGKLKKSALATSVIFHGDDNKYYEQVNKKCLDITEQIPFEIPENWVWVRMGQIGNWGAGSTPQRGDANYYNGKILWLKTGELNNGIVYDTEEKVTQKAFQDCSLRMNKIGDVLIAMYGATIGKLAIVGKELTTNQACCGCTPYLIYNWYLFYFLMASRDSFIKKGEGGAQPNISRVKLVEHLIPLPPLKEQYRIVTQIEKLFEQLR